MNARNKVLMVWGPLSAMAVCVGVGCAQDVPSSEPSSKAGLVAADSVVTQDPYATCESDCDVVGEITLDPVTGEQMICVEESCDGAPSSESGLNFLAPLGKTRKKKAVIAPTRCAAGSYSACTGKAPGAACNSNGTCRKDLVGDTCTCAVPAEQKCSMDSEDACKGQVPGTPCQGTIGSCHMSIYSKNCYCKKPSPSGPLDE